jgi:hypothetical protein
MRIRKNEKNIEHPTTQERKSKKVGLSSDAYMLRYHGRKR